MCHECAVHNMGPRITSFISRGLGNILLLALVHNYFQSDILDSISSGAREDINLMTLDSINGITFQ